MKVNLYYLSPNPFGGWVTFTYHLVRCLEAVGIKTNLLKVRPRTEEKQRPFGYGLQYRNVSTEDLPKGPSLIVAAAKNFRAETELLLRKGAGLVVHDPTELKNLPSSLPQKRCVVIRKIGNSYLPKATFIRHPYERIGSGKQADYTQKKKLAVSTSRIDFDKHTEIILDANRLLKDKHKVKIYGFENRIYSRFKLVPNYPEWEQSKCAYERTENAAYSLLTDYKFSVDMSEIKGDGGGTQYTFLESWDALTIPIINSLWIPHGNDDMKPKKNCLCVVDGRGLADLLKLLLSSEHSYLQELVAHGVAQLRKHTPSKIGQQYADLIKKL